MCPSLTISFRSSSSVSPVVYMILHQNIGAHPPKHPASQSTSGPCPPFPLPPLSAIAALKILLPRLPSSLVPLPFCFLLPPRSCCPPFSLLPPSPPGWPPCCAAFRRQLFPPDVHSAADSGEQTGLPPPSPAETPAAPGFLRHGVDIVYRDHIPPVVIRPEEL